MKRKIQFLIFMIPIIFLVGCSKEKCGSSQIKIMNWNLQTFFDAIPDGNEYEEFRNSKHSWNKDKYEKRLGRLATAIKSIDADLVILEELEKESQLQDIANHLSDTFDFSKMYKYALFTTNNNAPIGCAVLSRFPIDKISVHSLDIRIREKQPSMRSITKFTLHKEDKAVTVFVNHWKSKSGGAEESEIWRKRQESLLAALMKAELEKEDVPGLIAVGDFNKDIEEFDIRTDLESGKNIILHGKDNLEVYSPWIEKNGEILKTGSYWYKEKWERIDHFFAAGRIKIKEFSAETNGEWADSAGRPIRYKLWNGQGYSDHLPITCTIEF